MYPKRPRKRSRLAAANASTIASGASSGWPIERSATVLSPNSARSRSPSMNMRRIQPPSWSCARDHRGNRQQPRWQGLTHAGRAGDAAGVPAERVVAVEDLTRDRGAVQRPEGIDHDRELVGLARAIERRLERSGLRSMRQSADMVCERALADPASCRVVALDVVQHLVRVEVAVVVREHDRLGVPVELARHERADHDVVGLERLMDRRRHVKASGARLEIVDVEGHRVDGPVPADRRPTDGGRARTGSHGSRA